MMAGSLQEHSIFAVRGSITLGSIFQVRLLKIQARRRNVADSCHSCLGSPLNMLQNIFHA
jgi:hypothetical protein